MERAVERVFCRSRSPDDRENRSSEEAGGSRRSDVGGGDSAVGRFLNLGPHVFSQVVREASQRDVKTVRIRWMHDDFRCAVGPNGVGHSTRPEELFPGGAAIVGAPETDVFKCCVQNAV